MKTPSFLTKTSAAPGVSIPKPGPLPSRIERDFSAEKYTVQPGPATPRPLDRTGENPAIRDVQDRVLRASTWVQPLRQEMARVIVGQKQLLDRLMVGPLANGHVLLEGVPGLAKTLALKTLARPSPSISSACSSRRTCCPPTSSAR